MKLPDRELMKLPDHKLMKLISNVQSFEARGFAASLSLCGAAPRPRRAPPARAGGALGPAPPARGGPAQLFLQFLWQCFA